MKTLAGILTVGGGLLGAAMVAAFSALWSVSSFVTGAGATPSATAEQKIPSAMLDLYQLAAPTCPGLPWTVLAGVGSVESGNGTSDAPGVHSGSNSAGAEGPMQFEPATFSRYDDPVPPGGAVPPNPYDSADAVYAAARYLCSLGAPTDLFGSLIAYNCGNTGAACRSASTGYADRVIALAASFGGDTSGPNPEAASAVAAAESQVGVPYRWGGETPGGAFDCSGLVQWAYARIGIALPRTAQSQFDAGPYLTAVTPLRPGDLVFFGAGPRAVEHVGIVVGGDTMIDAPHAGADVRLDTFPAKPGLAWGSQIYVGATRPAG